MTLAILLAPHSISRSDFVAEHRGGLSVLRHQVSGDDASAAFGPSQRTFRSPCGSTEETDSTVIILPQGIAIEGKSRRFTDFPQIG
jgi:hypothetical protein